MQFADDDSCQSLIVLVRGRVRCLSMYSCQWCAVHLFIYYCQCFTFIEACFIDIINSFLGVLKDFPLIFGWSRHLRLEYTNKCQLLNMPLLFMLLMRNSSDKMRDDESVCVPHFDERGKDSCDNFSSPWKTTTNAEGVTQWPKDMERRTGYESRITALDHLSLFSEHFIVRDRHSKHNREKWSQNPSLSSNTHEVVMMTREATMRDVHNHETIREVHKTSSFSWLSGQQGHAWQQGHVWWQACIQQPSCRRWSSWACDPTLDIHKIPYEVWSCWPNKPTRGVLPKKEQWSKELSWCFFKVIFVKLKTFFQILGYLYENIWIDTQVDSSLTLGCPKW